jgi:predicted metal-dependent peptidase
MATKKSSLKIDTELSRCINQLLLKDPFFAHILAGTVRKITDEVPTAAVGFSNDLILLMVNEDFFLKELKSESERTAVLKHEVLHLVFRHLFRDKIKEDAELFNIAADIVVNQYIGSWKLPDSAVTLKTFPDLNLKPEQHLEYYYDILFKLNEANQQASANGKGEKGNQGNDQNGNSPSGSGDKPKNQPMNEKHPQSAKALADIYGHQRHSDHSKWVIKDGAKAKTADGKPITDNLISGIEQTLGKQLLEAAARTPSKHYGNLPTALITEIDLIRASMKTKVDWKRMLRIFSSSSGRTVIYHTMKRISKRYGTRPGIRIKQYKKIAVAIDTSGSIQETTLAQFFKEIDTIYRNGAEVFIIECDAAVGNAYPYKKNAPIKITGGGGTNYDPAFEYINKNKKLQIDACVYLTDGYAPKPTIKPRCKLLYVITPDGNKGDHLKWGNSILMK